MMAAAHHQSGFKSAVLRGRNWRALSGLGAAGRTGGIVSAVGTTSGATAARLATLSQRAAQTTPVQVVTRPGPGATASPSTAVTYACPTGLTYSNGACVAMPATQPASQQTSTPACPMGYLYNSGACVAAVAPASTTTNGTTTTTTTQTTDWLPWIIGGAVVLLIIGMSHK